MFRFNPKKENEFVNLNYEKPYSLITSVSIRRLPGDGEHIL